MKNLKFHYAAAWNFLPFGPEGVELNFNNYGNIVLVRGENLDVKPIDSGLPTDGVRECSNGTGKSTLQEILSWTFYGKTIKNPKKIKADGVIHNLVGKGCKTAVVVDKYRIERGRGPNFLRLWESESHIWNKDTEITQGEMKYTQKRIDEIVGLSYEAFVNICVFSDDLTACFLECDGPTKREIVENLLSLAVYRERHETAKEFLKEGKDSVKSLAKEYEFMLSSKRDAERRIEQAVEKEKQWRVARLSEAKDFIAKYQAKAKLLQATDTGAALLAYQQAQEKIKDINAAIPPLEEKQEARKKIVSQAREKEQTLKDSIKSIVDQAADCQRLVKDQTAKKKEHENFVSSLQANVPGTRCKHCNGVVHANDIEHACENKSAEIEACKAIIFQETQKAQELIKKIDGLKSQHERLKSIIADGDKKVSDGEAELRRMQKDLVTASQVREPKADSNELLIQQEIDQLKEQARKKKLESEGETPFAELIATANEELSGLVVSIANKEEGVKKAESRLPYYEYWVKAYGEKGIRRWVVDGIIPALNARITYWLQFLIENKINLSFDNELNETIERNPVDGDPYIYHAMSAGQRRRLNLAVSQAFAHVMTTCAGTAPSVVFLDEVTTNIDPQGVLGIYSMICELAQDKQVFVTTHDQDLLRMLSSADTINLRHQSGFTKMISE